MLLLFPDLQATDPEQAKASQGGSLLTALFEEGSYLEAFRVDHQRKSWRIYNRRRQALGYVSRQLGARLYALGVLREVPGHEQERLVFSRSGCRKLRGSYKIKKQYLAHYQARLRARQLALCQAPVVVPIAAWILEPELSTKPRKHGTT